mgnify:CR=1 FL=1
MQSQAISKKAKMIDNQLKILKIKLEYINNLDCTRESKLKELKSYHKNLGKALTTIDNIEIDLQNQSHSFVDVNKGKGMFTTLGYR